MNPIWLSCWDQKVSAILEIRPGFACGCRDMIASSLPNLLVYLTVDFLCFIYEPEVQFFLLCCGVAVRLKQLVPFSIRVLEQSLTGYIRTIILSMDNKNVT